MFRNISDIDCFLKNISASLFFNEKKQAIEFDFQIQHGAKGDEGGGVLEPHLCNLVCLGGPPQFWHWYGDDYIWEKEENSLKMGKLK